MILIKIGIPKGLLYPKYNVFAKTFIKELGAQAIVSIDTNKEILDCGVKTCVDEACLPIKVFFGHVYYLKDKCDMILIPRFISIEKNEYICPMFCGVIEMIKNNIDELPLLIDTPIYSTEKNKLEVWAKNSAKLITNDKKLINYALNKALLEHKKFKPGLNQDNYPIKVALIGHTYNINDSFINMDIISKLNSFGIGVITQEHIDKENIEIETAKLFKKPFWTFFKYYYGSAISIFRQKKADGIIYVSCFCCGIDSVAIELIEHEIGNFPFLILKLDEHTGEAGINTRIEAFCDLLKRSIKNDNNIPTLR